MRSDDVVGVEALQILVFPTLDDQQRFKRHHYRRHLELFPQGQFVAVDESAEPERIAGTTSSIRMDFDFERPSHRFDDISQGGYLTAHQPKGRWLYGADIGTDPEYRRRGIARSLYRCRHRTVDLLGLEGQVTVGMLRGYSEVKGRISVQRYYERVISGATYDPTISTQMRVGFEPRGLIENYLRDPVCDGWGVLMVLDRRAVIAPGVSEPRGLDTES